MRIVGAVLAVLGLWTLSPTSLAQTKGGAAKPAAHVVKPPAAKPGAPKAAAKPGKPAPAKAQPAAKKGAGKKASSRKTGDPTEPDEATRRIIAGLAAQKTVRESPELTQMRQVDLALFPSSAPDAGEPWQAEGSPLLTASEPKISASGLPPEGQLTAIAAPAATTKDLTWLKQLEMPDLPVRWDARVIRYLEFYKNDPRGKAMATVFLRKSGRYGGAIRRVLREQGLPEDILWLSLVESGFDPTIHSHAGAAGLWQFMPEGARIYGLYVDRWVDERHDPERSTLAAARYLSDLKTRFGTWELAFAAYNMGYGGLLAAIKKYNTNDFWELSKMEAGVPFETALYVPKIVAIAIVAKNKATFGLDSVELDPAVTFDKVSVSSGVSLQSVATAAGVSVDTLESYNPQILAGRTPPLAPGLSVDTKWTLRVPAGSGQKTSTALPKLIEAETKLLRYTVRFGESLEDLAAALKTTKSALAQLNGVKQGESVRPGTVLLIPASSGAGVAALSAGITSPTGQKPLVVVPGQSFASPGKRRVFYRVVSGDTLPEIAAVLGVSADDMARWNILDVGARLHDGMTLQAYVGEKHVLAGVVTLEEKDARILVVGSPEFFAHFEAQKGRDRVFVTVKEGDTWPGLAKKYGLSVGMLERINQRSRSSALTPGERVVVYVPAGHGPSAPLDKSDDKDKSEIAVASTTPTAPVLDTKSDTDPLKGADDKPDVALDPVKSASTKPNAAPISSPSKPPSDSAGAKSPSDTPGAKSPSDSAGAKSPSSTPGAKSPSDTPGAKSPSDTAGPVKAPQGASAPAPKSL